MPTPNHRYWDTSISMWYPLSKLKYISYSVTGRELFYNYETDKYFVCNEHVCSDIFSFTRIILKDDGEFAISLPEILEFEVSDTEPAEECFNLGELYSKFCMLVPDVVAERAYENIASQGECKPVLFLYDATEASL